MTRKETVREAGVLVLRAVIGAVFVAHGAQKLFSYGIPGVAGSFEQAGIPFPLLSAVAATGAELLGGLALILGLFTRPAAAALAFTMIVAMVSVHLKGGFFLPAGVEYTLTLLAVNASLVLTGPGVFSIDGSRSRRLRRADVVVPERANRRAVGVGS